MEDFIMPNRVRGWLYVFTAFFTPTLAYLRDTGRIDTELFVLGTAYITVISVMAKLNTPKSTAQNEGEK